MKLFQRRQTVATTRGMSKVVVNLKRNTSSQNGKVSQPSKRKTSVTDKEKKTTTTKQGQ
jgi:hypothetical protein